MIKREKRSTFNGSLGRELEAIWEAILSQQIVSSPDCEIEQRPSGTIIKPKIKKPYQEESASTTIIDTYVSDFLCYDNTVTYAGGLAVYNPTNEVFFTDVQGRNVAIPPLGITTKLAYEYNLQGYVAPYLNSDIYPNATTTSVYRYPFPEKMHYEHAYLEEATSMISWGQLDKWNFSPYYTQERIQILHIPEGIYVPLGDIINDPQFPLHYTMEDDPLGGGGGMNNLGTGKVMKVYYLDMNIARRHGAFITSAGNTAALRSIPWLDAAMAYPN